jgi:hypothetical protein
MKFVNKPTNHKWWQEDTPFVTQWHLCITLPITNGVSFYTYSKKIYLLILGKNNFCSNLFCYSTNGSFNTKIDSKMCQRKIARSYWIELVNNEEIF